jgi:hypothetical protein
MCLCYLTQGIIVREQRKKIFEKWWLQRVEFIEVVNKAGGGECDMVDPIEIWQFLKRSLRRMIRGWATNVVAELNREKQALGAEFNWLDMEAEQRPLDEGELIKMKSLARDLDRIWALEEIKIR